jgi:hypothetical protein
MVEVWLFAVCDGEEDAGGGVAGGWKAHCKKWMSAPTSSSSFFPSSVASSAGFSAGRGSGRMNCGWDRAADAIRWYVSSGMTAQIERGLFACRRRHSISISLAGRARIFSTSRYELRGLMPGVPETAFAAAAREGEGDGDDDGDDTDDGVGDGSEDEAVLLGEEEEDDFSPGVAAVDNLRRYSEIFSL